MSFFLSSASMMKRRKKANSLLPFSLPYSNSHLSSSRGSQSISSNIPCQCKGRRWPFRQTRAASADASRWRPPPLEHCRRLHLRRRRRRRRWLASSAPSRCRRPTSLLQQQLREKGLRRPDPLCACAPSLRRETEGAEEKGKKRLTSLNGLCRARELAGRFSQKKSRARPSRPSDTGPHLFSVAPTLSLLPLVRNNELSSPVTRI